MFGVTIKKSDFEAQIPAKLSWKQLRNAIWASLQQIPSFSSREEEKLTKGQKVGTNRDTFLTHVWCYNQEIRFWSADTCQVYLENSWEMQYEQVYSRSPAFLPESTESRLKWKSKCYTSECLSYELYPVTISVFDGNGFMRQVTKADLAKFLLTETDWECIS